MFKALSLGLIASLLVFVSTAQANPHVYGQWRSVQEFDDLAFSFALSIEKNKSTLTMTCSEGNKFAKVSVTVPTEVREDEIYVKGSAQDEKKFLGMDCALNIKPMIVEYRMEGRNVLYISADGQIMTFDRVK